MNQTPTPRKCQHLDCNKVELPNQVVMTTCELCNDTFCCRHCFGNQISDTDKTPKTVCIDCKNAGGYYSQHMHKMKTLYKNN